MKINRNNYEIWFLDFCEGRLSMEQVNELMEFIELHYDLKEEFDSFENISLPPAKKIVFDSKDLLKRSAVKAVGNINEQSFNDFFIAYHEGDLNEEEKINVLQFVEQNPSLKKDFEIFEKSKVEADQKIKFDRKEELKGITIKATSNINKDNYVEFFIGALEGDLDIGQRTELNDFLKFNPHLSGDYSLFSLTRVAPDKSVVFTDKERMKKPVLAKSTASVRYLYYAVSAVASIILLLAIYFMMNQNGVQKVNTAFRNNIELPNNAIQNTIDQNENATQGYNFNDMQQYAANGNAYSNKKAEYNEYMYATALNTGLIGEDDRSNADQLEKITVYEDFYAMMQKKRNEQEALQQDQGKEKDYMSLKDYALFRTKKALTPDTEKENVKPTDKITGWDLANAGVNEFNKLTGSKAKIARDPDKKGFRFSFGDNFEIARNTSR